jgi:hypothetical protein
MSFKTIEKSNFTFCVCAYVCVHEHNESWKDVPEVLILSRMVRILQISSVLACIFACNVIYCITHFQLTLNIHRMDH